MEQLPPTIAAMASKIAIPKPDTSDPNSTVTMGAEQINRLGILFEALISYLETQYARCAEKASPSPATP